MSNKTRTAAVAFTASGVLLCALTLASRQLYDYYPLRPWLHHPLTFLVSAIAAFGAAWGLWIKRPVLKWVGILVFAVAGVAALGLAWFLAPFRQDLTEVSRQPAPGGGMELIVYEGHNWIDPFWELRVRTDNGFLSRERDLGCVNGDFMGLSRFEWTGPRTVLAQLSNGDTFELHLDDAARPDRRVDGGC